MRALKTALWGGMSAPDSAPPCRCTPRRCAGTSLRPRRGSCRRHAPEHGGNGGCQVLQRLLCRYPGIQQRLRALAHDFRGQPSQLRRGAEPLGEGTLSRERGCRGAQVCEWRRSPLEVAGMGGHRAVTLAFTTKQAHCNGARPTPPHTHRPCQPLAWMRRCCSVPLTALSLVPVPPTHSSSTERRTQSWLVVMRVPAARGSGAGL